MNVLSTKELKTAENERLIYERVKHSWEWKFNQRKS